jgi:hypothetical protein
MAFIQSVRPAIFFRIFRNRSLAFLIQRLKSPLPVVISALGPLAHATHLWGHTFNRRPASDKAVASAYSFSNSSCDLPIVFDLLLAKIKDHLPAVSGKRS